MVRLPASFEDNGGPCVRTSPQRSEDRGALQLQGHCISDQQPTDPLSAACQSSQLLGPLGSSPSATVRSSLHNPVSPISNASSTHLRGKALSPGMQRMLTLVELAEREGDFSISP